jgi:uncharacterized protein (DUF1501 family)
VSEQERIMALVEGALANLNQLTDELGAEWSDVEFAELAEARDLLAAWFYGRDSEAS